MVVKNMKFSIPEKAWQNRDIDTFQVAGSCFYCSQEYIAEYENQLNIQIEPIFNKRFFEIYFIGGNHPASLIQLFLVSSETTEQLKTLRGNCGCFGVFVCLYFA